MTKDEELLAFLLADGGAFALDPRFAARVQALARAAFAPAGAPPERAPDRLRLAVGRALVPTLLLSAAVVGAAHTVEVAAKIYDGARKEGGSEEGR